MSAKSRLVLTDRQGALLSGLIIGRPDQRGSTGRNNRMFVEGVLWIVRTGSPWRDLPEAFGGWNSVFKRFSRWSAKGVWRRIFEAMADDPDFEYMTPHSVHYGQTDTLLATRQTAFDAAFQRHPNRFKAKNPQPQAVPEAVWINPPMKDKITTQQTQICSVNS